MRELWQEFVSEFKFVLRWFGFVLFATVFVIALAFLSVLLWAILQPILEGWIKQSAFDTSQQQYISNAIVQLADWTWQFILLGGFIAFLYEQLKDWREIFVKRRAIREHLRQVEKDRKWGLLDDLLAEFKGVGIEARDAELARDFAHTYRTRALDPHTQNWKEAYQPKGWLTIANELDREDVETELLLAFPKNISSSEERNWEKAVMCLRNLETEILHGFMEYHTEVIQEAIEDAPERQRELVEIVKHKQPTPLVQILQIILKDPLPADEETRRFLRFHQIDEKSYQGGGLKGRAEYEPKDLFQFPLDPKSQQPQADDKLTGCLIDFVKLTLEPEHLLIVGGVGEGKTFLARQIDHWASKTKNPLNIAVNWTSIRRLMDQEEKSMPILRDSLVDDIAKTIAKDKRFSGLGINIRLDNTRSIDWSTRLSALKPKLASVGVKHIYILVDDLYKYEDFPKVEIQQLAAKCLLHPAIADSPPRCYFRFFVPKNMFSVTSYPWNNYKPLILNWDDQQKSKMLNLRLNYLTGYGIPKSLEEFFEQSPHEPLRLTDSSPRSVIEQLDQLLQGVFERSEQKAGG